MRTPLLAALSLALAAGAAAQSADASPTPADPVTLTLSGIHDMTSGNILATAELLDDDLYAYRPTEEVRSSGEMLGHIANAQYLFCSAAAGEDNPNGTNFEEAPTKDAIVPALRAAFAYCSGVYDAMTDAQGAEIREFFGRQMAAAGILSFNTTHNYEHYGNLVTYMRMNGIVPPSSQM